MLRETDDSMNKTCAMFHILRALRKLKKIIPRLHYVQILARYVVNQIVS